MLQEIANLIQRQNDNNFINLVYNIYVNNVSCLCDIACLIFKSILCVTCICIFIGFVISPHRKWVLETGREYEIVIEMYDKNSHKIYPSDVSTCTAIDYL